MKRSAVVDYDELRERFASALESAAESHETGDLPGIASGYDELDAALPRNDDPRYQKLHIALSYWDGWIDASNHDWLFYDIGRFEWPIVARDIARAVREDSNINEERVLAAFDWQRVRAQPSIWSRLKALFSRPPSS